MTSICFIWVYLNQKNDIDVQANDFRRMYSYLTHVSIQDVYFCSWANCSTVVSSSEELTRMEQQIWFHFQSPLTQWILRGGR